MSIRDYKKRLKQIDMEAIASEVERRQDIAMQPRVAKRKRVKDPVDQRTSFSLREDEKEWLKDHIKRLKAEGERGASLTRHVRQQAKASIDIAKWAEIAEQAIEEITTTKEHEDDYVAELERLAHALRDSELSEEQAYVIRERIGELEHLLNKIVRMPAGRGPRLSGRFTYQELETARWQAQQLMISTSDLLRMKVFGLEPNSKADMHLSYEQKLLFYTAILKIAHEGWKDVPQFVQPCVCGGVKTD